MGKAAILFVSGFCMLGVFYLMGTQRGLAETEQQLAEHQYKELARSAALAGYQQARQALAEDFDDTSPISGTYESAGYSVVLTRTGDIGRITSTGTMATGTGNHVTFRIIADIERELVQEIADAPPPFMEYALLTEKNLSLNGDILADLYVLGDMDNTLNANVHTNGNLNIKGNSVEVHGFGTYVGTGSASPAKALTNSFKPYYNPTNAPTSARASRVDIPAFDADAFLGRVSVDQTTEGDVTISGNLNLGGTRDNPYIWFIDGDLRASGNVTISGYALFIVTGDLNFNGSVQAGASGYDGADESSIAFYVGNDVDLGGNVDVYGQLYIAGDLDFMHGTPSVYGTITTLGTATLKGTPNIYYRPASPALTIIFQDPEVRYRLISYSEW